MKRPTIPQLIALRILVENPSWAFCTSASINSPNSVSIVDKETGKHKSTISGRFHDGDFPKVSGSVVHSLWKSGCIENYRGEIDKSNPDLSWAWYDSPSRLTEQGEAVYEEFKQLLIDHEEKEAKKRAKVNRLIIVGAEASFYSKERELEPSYDRKYGLLCRVIKETQKRLYVEPVAHYDNKTGWGGKGIDTFRTPVEGNTGNLYCSRDSVVLDGTTEEVFRRLVQMENEKIDDLIRLQDQEKAEIDPIRERYRQRRSQNASMYEDMVREIMESQDGERVQKGGDDTSGI